MADTTTSTTASASESINDNHHHKDDGTISNVMICPDGHSCENGSLCIENAKKEGQYFCDCEEGIFSGMKVFTGLYCQHEATVFCTLTGELSTVGFCANGGTCIGYLEQNGNNHVGCKCPRGYTGKHCQFVEGSLPEEGFPLENTNSDANALASSSTNMSMPSRGLSAAGIVVTVFCLVVALGMLGTALLVVRRRWRQHAATHTIEHTKSADGHLYEADGADLAALPTQSFESDQSSEAAASPTNSSNDNNSNIDDHELQPSESAEMA